MNPIEFLTFIDASLKSFRKAGAIYQAELAPSFSPIEVLNPNENALSRFFAELLSPVGGHGQGNLFLKLFVEHFKFSDDWIDLDSPITRTEHSTDQDRRIDISIKFYEGIIGIENKPWAGDQKDQVKDYIKYLRDYWPNKHYLIYLSPNGESPSIYSTGGDQFDTLRLISYADWNQWLVKCAEKARSKRVQFFIEEFVRYINKKFFGVKNMNETNFLVSQILLSSDKIKSAFEIYATHNALLENLLDKLTTDINRCVADRNFQLTVLPDNDLSKVNAGISFKVNEFDSYIFRLEFAGASYRKAFIGIKKVHHEIPDKESLKLALSAISGYTKLENIWPWYKEFPTFNGIFDSVTWVNIHNGTMANEIVKDIGVLYQGLNESDGGLDLLN